VVHESGGITVRSTDDITRKLQCDHCGYCGANLADGVWSRRISIVDRKLDCVVAFKCPDCGTEEPEQLGRIIALADPAAFQRRNGDR
jgi:predicted RNA-binding Zn-ribbon protein involved in translation (DUF1610 family)